MIKRKKAHTDHGMLQSAEELGQRWQIIMIQVDRALTWHVCLGLYTVQQHYQGIILFFIKAP